MFNFTNVTIIFIYKLKFPTKKNFFRTKLKNLRHFYALFFGSFVFFTEGGCLIFWLRKLNIFLNFNNTYLESCHQRMSVRDIND